MKKRVHHWIDANLLNLEGKTALVTGATNGLGLEVSRLLVRQGARVIMGCRSREKGDLRRAEVQSSCPGGPVETVMLDLADLASIQRCSDALHDRLQSLDILINNAGIMAVPYHRTVDGFELQLGTNHWGHFALTGRLWDLVCAAPEARVITVSSIAHRMGAVDFTDLQWEKKYLAWPAYGRSKLANLLFAYELQRKCEERSLPVLSCAVHPGWAATDLQQVAPRLEGNKGKEMIIGLANHLLAQHPIMGALPALYAAAAPTITGGACIGPGGAFQLRGFPRRVSSNRRSHDRALAQRLWEVSQQLTGVRFPD